MLSEVMKATNKALPLVSVSCYVAAGLLIARKVIPATAAVTCKIGSKVAVLIANKTTPLKPDTTSLKSGNVTVKNLNAAGNRFMILAKNHLVRDLTIATVLVVTGLLADYAQGFSDFSEELKDPCALEDNRILENDLCPVEEEGLSEEIAHSHASVIIGPLERAIVPLRSDIIVRSDFNFFPEKKVFIGEYTNLKKEGLFSLIAPVGKTVTVVEKVTSLWANQGRENALMSAISLDKGLTVFENVTSLCDNQVDKKVLVPAITVAENVSSLWKTLSTLYEKISNFAEATDVTRKIFFENRQLIGNSLMTGALITSVTNKKMGVVAIVAVTAFQIFDKWAFP